MKPNEKDQHFSELYTTHIDEIYQYVFLRTGLNKVTTEDLTQEIFIDVFKGLDHFKGLSSERTWIYKIAKNKVFNYYRTHYKRSMESCHLSDEMINQLVDPHQDVETKISETCQGQQVLACLRQLPDHYIMTLLLKYVDGKSIKEIATITDKSNKAVESVLQRAKAAFQKQYQKIEEGEV